MVNRRLSPAIAANSAQVRREACEAGLVTTMRVDRSARLLNDVVNLDPAFLHLAVEAPRPPVLEFEGSGRKDHAPIPEFFAWAVRTVVWDVLVVVAGACRNDSLAMVMRFDLGFPIGAENRPILSLHADALTGAHDQACLSRGHSKIMCVQIEGLLRPDDHAPIGPRDRRVVRALQAVSFARYAASVTGASRKDYERTER